MPDIDFEAAFHALTGNGPFPWQWALFDRFCSARDDNIPASCNLPTGLGKTSVIHVWLLALASGARVPRRLVYVVNRRTVVDQTTDEVEKLRERLPTASSVNDALWGLCALKPKQITEKDRPLAVSTLRGQFADNREWSADPARPAVICGTVDMIGSRLLFGGYGCGFKARPLHAGFLGQDALIVHDEAHLEPAFQRLLLAVQCEQRGGRLNERDECEIVTKTRDFHPLRVMELTATSRTGGTPFTLTAADQANETVRTRVNAKKALHLHALGDEKKLAEAIGRKALEFKDSGKTIIVFVRKVEDVEKVVAQLKKAKQHHVQQLTGTLRGWERDRMANPRREDGCPVFARFLPPPKADAPNAERWKVTPRAGTVYLVCTSAGEVGVNISADHLVCDLSTFESMAQRFGRVNRFGRYDSTEIHVFHPAEFDAGSDLDTRRCRTLELLWWLLGDASPAALGRLDPAARVAAFAPPPVVVPVTDILFDAWALTSVREALPGRPPVDDFLHGISDDPPQTAVAWREDVERLTEAVLAANRLTAEAALDLFPLKPHETLSGPTLGKGKVFEQLEVVAARDAERKPGDRLPAWVVEGDGRVAVVSLQDLVKRDKKNNPVVPLGGRTVVLPPAAGGFADGTLRGDIPFNEGTRYDVSEEFFVDKERTVPRRARVWDDEPVPAGMRLVRRVNIPPTDGDEDAEARSWRWYERPAGGDDDGSKSAATKEPIAWQHHTDDVVTNTDRIATALRLNDDLKRALVVAAKLHDLGKCRGLWQRSIGNPNPKEWFAKSGRDWTAREITEYRHEFGSLLDAGEHKEFADLNDEWRAFVLHVVAAHHGRGRPHFPADEVFDPEPKGRDIAAARAVPQRFGQLQRTYGRWGLAYLESLLRAADYAASANPSAPGKECSG